MSMSFLNTQMCCMDCLDKEEEHPQFKKVKEEEARQVKAGNYNYDPNVTVNYGDKDE
jgi:hypothetical protein